ncbi:enoyl-CoA hydratase/3-hydroxyisobutyryl-CoA hydrolase [Arboricoccus pini]|uniref:3-hydroxyisobutyryl-CoA hydrolase n=1 Tax=Arboricoccus pini TaxID=1963835 RepID=A0A212QSC0_9PROT|nr:enoyl-CoA hydratase/isomerase family protein [Arboricoccus pini]SNB62488.1 enoyl-CoA hydratase/3-hydroxyisobutyryl-CoA hydrolase [Arboricoccus pini]
MSDYVRVKRNGSAGIIQLDRPSALNALDHEMVRAISDQLEGWRDDPLVACIILKGTPGRAFCAGGDVRAVIMKCNAQGPAAAASFFHDEYRLNAQIARFPKPVVSFMDGITMGGGCGLAVHGSYRIATENTVLAMPEAMIGFFPDVGAGYFLSRSPPGVGAYMALTGARLNAEEAVFAGLATHRLAAASLLELETAIADLPAEGQRLKIRLRDLIGSRVRPCSSSENSLGERASTIADLFGQPSLQNLLDKLERAGEVPWLAEALALIRERSPLSCRLAWSLLQRGAELDLESDLCLEYRMACRSLEVGDFAEGVRALLIDKDKQPHWQHPSIERVNDAEVEAFFQPFKNTEDELVLM